jgi:hypothetical protein
VLSFATAGRNGGPHNKKKREATIMAGWRLLSVAVLACVCSAQAALAQVNAPPSYPCVNDAPDPYQRGK